MDREDYEAGRKDNNMDEDDAIYEEIAAQKKKEEGKDLSHLYVDPANGESFNPEKKFGIIESNSLIYDNVTTSYPLNLPTDYYTKYI
jgi:hypothetical protein